MTRPLLPPPIYRAAPFDEPVPSRRNLPPVPEPEPVKAEAPNPARHDHDAVETWRRLQALESRRDRNGAIRVNVTLTTGPGGDPWHWSPRNRVAIPCKGAVFPSKSEARHLIKGISEASAQREILRSELAAVGGDMERLPPDQMAAAIGWNPARLERKRPRGRK